MTGEMEPGPRGRAEIGTIAVVAATAGVLAMINPSIGGGWVLSTVVVTLLRR